jgi:hypothetical protein
MEILMSDFAGLLNAIENDSSGATDATDQMDQTVADEFAAVLATMFAPVMTQPVQAESSRSQSENVKPEQPMITVTTASAADTLIAPPLSLPEMIAEMKATAISRPAVETVSETRIIEPGNHLNRLTATIRPDTVRHAAPDTQLRTDQNQALPEQVKTEQPQSPKIAERVECGGLAPLSQSLIAPPGEQMEKRRQAAALHTLRDAELITLPDQVASEIPNAVVRHTQPQTDFAQTDSDFVLSRVAAIQPERSRNTEIAEVTVRVVKENAPVAGSKREVEIIPRAENVSEPEGLIRRVIEQAATARADQAPGSQFVNDDPVDSVSGAATCVAPGTVSGATATGSSLRAIEADQSRPGENQPESERAVRSLIQANDDAKETVIQSKPLRKTEALKPLIAELRLPTREKTAQASEPESSLPRSIGIAGGRIEPQTKIINAAETQTVIRQTAAPIIAVAEHLERGEARTISFNLHPQELGRIEVRIERDEAGRLNALLTIERDETRRALGAGLTELRASLESSGLAIERLEIRTAPARADEPLQNFSGNTHGQPRQTFHEQPASRFSDSSSDQSLNQNLAVPPATVEDRLLSRRA